MSKELFKYEYVWEAGNDNTVKINRSVDLSLSEANTLKLFTLCTNFYAILLNLLYDSEMIAETWEAIIESTQNDEIEDEDEDDNEKERKESLQIINNVINNSKKIDHKEIILNQVKDKSAFKDFVNKINKEPNFAKAVFKTYLESILLED